MKIVGDAKWQGKKKTQRSTLDMSFEMAINQVERNVKKTALHIQSSWDK